MIETVAEVARCMKINRLTFISLSQREHDDALKAGFTPILTTYYTLHVVKGERPLASLRDINEMNTVFFEMFLPPIVPYYEIHVKGIDKVAEKRFEEERRAKSERQLFPEFTRES